MPTIPNRNIFWAKTFVDELARCGLEAVCIAPGSRSTPLVIAFAENPHIRVYSHIDERSAAFFALGLALATDKPVAVLCSSGTATANFHPAVIEARYANVPLLVLTADRPHELRDSGANQTVDQVKMFGSHVLWAHDVALPEAHPPAVALRNLRTLADRAYAKADGLSGLEKGPVHLNFPFRKPLEPTLVAEEAVELTDEGADDTSPFTRFVGPNLRPSQDDGTPPLLADLIRSHPRGLIICGPRCPGGDFGAQLARFSKATGYPVLADSLSGLRFHPHITPISGYDTFLQGEPPFAPPEVLIHIGAMPASSALEGYLNRITPAHRLLITPTGTWTDAYHRLTEVITADPGGLLDALNARPLGARPDAAWLSAIDEAEQRTWAVLTTELDRELFDGSAIATVVGELPDGAHLFIASSLPVRHLEQFAAPRSVNLHVYANRGASGIDGTVSSALGVAAAHPDKPVILITGDLAFYHDMNGLLAIKRCGITNLTIILVNNDGGGIFQRLPIAQFDPPFTELFLTPHGLEFEWAARLYGLDYRHAGSLGELRADVSEALAAHRPALIEVRTEVQHDYARREAISHLARQQLTL